MQRAAVVYRINDRLIIGASRRTATGLRLEVEPRAVEADAELPRIVSALSSALDASTPAAVPPGDWRGFFDPFLKAAGVRTFKAFMAAAQSVDVDEENGAFIVTPNRNLGPKDGFEPIRSRASKVPDLGSVANALLENLGPP